MSHLPLTNAMPSRPAVVRTVTLTACVVGALALAGACSSYHVTSRIDTKADFSTYHTFAWMPHVDSLESTRDREDYDDDILEARVHEAVSKEMRDRKLTRNMSAPDLLLQYHVGTREVRQVISTPNFTYYPAPYWSPIYRRAYPSYYYYGSPYMVSNTLQVENVTNGRFMIDAIDRKTGKLVWRGISTGSLPSPDEFDREIAGIVHDVFKTYP